MGKYELRTTNYELGATKYEVGSGLGLEFWLLHLQNYRSTSPTYDSSPGILKEIFSGLRDSVFQLTESNPAAP